MIKDPAHRHKKIMVIDDTMMDRFIVSRMCEMANYAAEVLQMESAIEALTYLSQHAEHIDSLPEVILVDINMPVMDGFQFLNEFELFQSRIKDFCKIYLLTSSVNPSDKSRSDANPYIIAMINKPLTVEKLGKLV